MPDPERRQFDASGNCPPIVTRPSSEMGTKLALTLLDDLICDALDIVDRFEHEDPARVARSSRRYLDALRARVKEIHDGC